MDVEHLLNVTGTVLFQHPSREEPSILFLLGTITCGFLSTTDRASHSLGPGTKDAGLRDSVLNPQNSEERLPPRITESVALIISRQVSEEIVTDVRYCELSVARIGPSREQGMPEYQELQKPEELIIRSQSKQNITTSWLVESLYEHEKPACAEVGNKRGRSLGQARRRGRKRQERQ